MFLPHNTPPSLVHVQNTVRYRTQANKQKTGKLNKKNGKDKVGQSWAYRQKKNSGPYLPTSTLAVGWESYSSEGLDSQHCPTTIAVHINTEAEETNASSEVRQHIVGTVRNQLHSQVQHLPHISIYSSDKYTPLHLQQEERSKSNQRLHKQKICARGIVPGVFHVTVQQKQGRRKVLLR